jgi:GDPmannose 4,6-dehydratase
MIYGLKRRSSLFKTYRFDHLYQDTHLENKNFILHYGDITDNNNFIHLIQSEEIYNLADMINVAVSLETLQYTAKAGNQKIKLEEGILSTVP